jgi:hypothetical protein
LFCPVFVTKPEGQRSHPNLGTPLLANYNGLVARGWESKSVEAQQAEATETPSVRRVKLTPEAAARKRDRENLELARRRVFQQLEASQNPRHQKLLQDSLTDLDEKLRALE